MEDQALHSKDSEVRAQLTEDVKGANAELRVCQVSFLTLLKKPFVSLRESLTILQTGGTPFCGFDGHDT